MNGWALRVYLNLKQYNNIIQIIVILPKIFWQPKDFIFRFFIINFGSQYL